MNTFKVLDCSLRDGGYQNNWAFPGKFVRRHVDLVSKSGADFVEVGFRFNQSENDKFRGITAFSSRTLFSLLEEATCPLGIMVNASDLDINSNFDKTFPPGLDAENLNFVRVASRLSDLDHSLDLVERLKEIGLVVFLNIMQAHELHVLDFDRITGKTSRVKPDFLVFADSLGSMAPRDISNLFTHISQRTDIPLGFHGHDNRGLALANSLEAAASGATILDGTMLGMGRGAGNARLEGLMLEREPFSVLNSSFVELQALWRDHLSTDFPERSWGWKSEYHFAAKALLHPSYPQTLLEDGSFSVSQRRSIISNLSLSPQESFNPERLQIGTEWFAKPGTTDPTIEKIFAGAEVLLLGKGISTHNYEEELELYSIANGLTVLQIGIAEVQRSWVKHSVICNPVTFMSETPKLHSHGAVIGPFSQIPLANRESFQHLKRISVNVGISESGFRKTGNRFWLPSYRSSVLALGLATLLSSKSILMAGFDGYRDSDARNTELTDILISLQAQGVALHSLTPTKLPVSFRPIA